MSHLVLLMRRSSSSSRKRTITPPLSSSLIFCEKCRHRLGGGGYSRDNIRLFTSKRRNHHHHQQQQQQQLQKHNSTWIINNNNNDRPFGGGGTSRSWIHWINNNKNSNSHNNSTWNQQHQRRWLASSSSSSKEEEEEGESGGQQQQQQQQQGGYYWDQQQQDQQQKILLQERIVEICDDTIIPYGEFTLDIWKESLQLLEEMTTTTTPIGSLECSCMLFERLVIEQSTTTTTTLTTKEQHPMLMLLTTESLNLVIENWNYCWQQQQHQQQQQGLPHHHQTTTRVPNPSEMLSLMDDWIYRLLDHDDGGDNVPPLHPDVNTYSALIQGAIYNNSNSNSNSNNNNKRHHGTTMMMMDESTTTRDFVETIFHRMIMESKNRIHPNVTPNNSIYETLIHYFAVQLCDIERAEEILNDMYMEYAAASGSTANKVIVVVEPNIKVFTSLLTGYSKKCFAAGGGGGGGGKNNNNNNNELQLQLQQLPFRAENILRHMQHLNESKTLPNNNVKPTTYIYCLVLKCYSSLTSFQKEDHQQTTAAKEEVKQRVLNLYNEMKSSRHWDILRPTSQALGYVLKTVSNTGDYIGAQALLEEHLSSGTTSHHHHQQPQQQQQLPQQPKPQQQQQLLPKPDNSCFRSVLVAWVESGGDAKALDNVERILRIMKETKSISVDTFVYNIILKCLVLHPTTTTATTTSNNNSVQEEEKEEGGGRHPLLSSLQERVQRAEEIVKEMEDLAAARHHHHHQRIRVQPNVHSYNRLIQLHVMNRQPHKAEEILERMYDFHLKQQHDNNNDKDKTTTKKKKKVNSGTRPDKASFTLCLQAWADYNNKNSSSSNNKTASGSSSDEKELHDDDGDDYYDGPKRAEAILRRMWELYRSGVLPNVRPDAICYTTVLKSIAHSGRQDAGERCQRLVEEMERHSLQPDPGCYGLCIHAWARSSNDPKRAEEQLNRWLDKHREGEINGTPKEGIFNSILRALSRTDKLEAGHKAQDMIDRMYQLHKSGLLEAPPGRDTYLCLVNCWLHSHSPWAGEHALNALTKMESIAASKPEKQDMAPTIEEYNAVLRSFAKAGRGAKAHELLDRLLHRSLNQQEDHCRPNLETFRSVLWAWNMSQKDPNAPNKVESILEQMDFLVRDGEIPRIEPDTDCLNLSLDCLAKQRRNMSPGRLESLLRKYEAIANRTSWNTVINFCASLGNARKAEILMRSMYDTGKSNTNPDTGTYTMVLKAMRNSVDNDKGERAEALLREMYERHDRGEMVRVKPNHATFSTVMQCYLKSHHPDAVDRVLALRDEVIERGKSGEEDIMLDNVMFHIVMQTHCRHGDPNAAETLLNQLCQGALEGKNEQGWELNGQSFISVLGSWVSANNPHRAEAILEQMREYWDMGIPNVKPLPKNYLKVIECWMRSQEPFAAERADSILQKMERDYPKVVAGKGLYLSIMKGLAHTGCGARAEALLRRVQILFEGERDNTEIDLFLYREVCLAWEQSKSSEAAERIEALEGEMSVRFPIIRAKQ